MAIVDVVKWDAEPGVLAWKYPSCELSSWTQLIVSESQEATMFREGQAVGPFGAGRHVLSSDNYPILKDLLKIPFGRSPYTAEVWFVQKTFKLNILWGTTSPIQLEDPKYHIMLPVRVFGQYGITVSNTVKFLMKLVGTMPCFTEAAVREYFKGIIITRVKAIVANYIVVKNISILHISVHLNELSQAVQQQLVDEMDEFGLTITNFNINGISTDENDPAVAKLRAVLAKKAEMDILGFDYKQKRSFDTLQTAAANEGNGNMLNTGVGMGMGLGLGSSLGQIFGKLGEFIDVTNKPKNIVVEKSGNQCRKCGQSSPPESKFCIACGNHFFLCSQCGTDNEENSAVCSKCNAAFKKKCSQCNAEVKAGQRFCSSCGESLIKICKKCSAELSKDSKFCSFCGTEMEK